MEILNLNAVVADDKQIVVGNETFLIPGTLSTGRMLALIKHMQRLKDDGANPDVIEKTFEIVYSVFKIKNPDLSFERFTDIITLDMLPQVITFIYNVNTPEEKKTVSQPETETE